MAKFVESPIPQFLDDSGNPLVGGTVTAYVAGTTTLTSIYPTLADAAADTNALPNPNTLNASGYPQTAGLTTTPIAVAGNVKLVVKDSAGTTRYTVDNYNPIGNGIADSNGNLVISFTSTGSAVNHIDLTNAAAGNDPVIGVAGTDSNIGIKITPDGTGDVTITVGDLIMANGAINEDRGSDIASATTTDIGAAAGNYVEITGTTTITGLGTVQAGTRRIVRFADALTLTHNATSLILPGAANITTVAGDSATFVSLGSGNWVCTNYTKSSGAALIAGTGVKQVVTAVLTSLTGGTTVMPYDDTIPQNGEGDQYITATITPTNATYKLIIDVVLHCSINTATAVSMALFQDSTAAAISAAAKSMPLTDEIQPFTLRHIMTAGTTSATTFKVRAGPAISATLTINGAAAARKFGGVLTSSLTITEVLV